MTEHRPSESLDVGTLLTIDVESELRKLTQAQLQGSWQLPAELVRRAIRQGARAVEVELGRQQLRVRWPGAGFDPAVLHEVAVLLDPRRSSERRHRALTLLERDGALALLGLVGLEPAAIRIVSAAVAGQPSHALEWRGDGTIGLREVDRVSHSEIAVRGPKFDRVRARTHLAEAGRFASVVAPVEISIDGRAIGQGFEDALAEARIAEPLPGLLAIPRTGELARVILLQHGIVTGHLSLPDPPCFSVALETEAIAEPGASAARLRDLIAPRLDRVRDVAVECMIEVARQGAALGSADRSRLTQQLLHAARRGGDRAKAIARLPIFRGLEPDGRERWHDLLALRQSVHEEAGERLLTAVFPDQDPTEFAPEGRIYVLDESERALLGEMLELGFRQPRRRVGRRLSLADLARHGLVAGIRDRLVGLRPGGRPIPDHELEPDERFLLIQLRAQLEQCEVAMCSGDGRVRRRGAGPDRLLLPRGSAKVRAGVRAVARDAGWVYPTLLALLDGRDFPHRARRRWGRDNWRSSS